MIECILYITLTTQSEHHSRDLGHTKKLSHCFRHNKNFCHSISHPIQLFCRLICTSTMVTLVKSVSTSAVSLRWCQVNRPSRLQFHQSITRKIGCGSEEELRKHQGFTVESLVLLELYQENCSFKPCYIRVSLEGLK